LSPCTARATRCYWRGDIAHQPDLRSRHSGWAPLSRTRQCEQQPLGGPKSLVWVNNSSCGLEQDRQPSPRKPTNRFFNRQARRRAKLRHQTGPPCAAPAPRLRPRPRRRAAAVAALIALQDKYRASPDNLPDNLEEQVQLPLCYTIPLRRVSRFLPGLPPAYRGPPEAREYIVSVAKKRQPALTFLAETSHHNDRLPDVPPAVTDTVRNPLTKRLRKAQPSGSPWSFSFATELRDIIRRD